MRLSGMFLGRSSRSIASSYQFRLLSGSVRRTDESSVNAKRMPAASPLYLSSPPTPKEIVKHFDKHVIGQEQAKRVMAVAIYNHYCRLYQASRAAEDRDAGGEEEAMLQKSNIMLIGPSGTGKTLLAKTAADILHVPFAVADATGFTEAGYVGEDVDLMLYRLLEASGHDLAVAEKGIVFLDEIDKLASRSSPTHGGRDVGGQGVQQALLKMVEGSSTVDVKDRRRGGGDRASIPFDTSSVLFIFSGAFNGLDAIVRDRLVQKSIGFQGEKGLDVDDKSRNGRVMAPDLAVFGLIPEFLGRVPVLATLEELDQAALERILTEPSGNLIAQYQSLFRLHSCQLEFTPSAITAIAALALRLKVGARGLRSIVEGVLVEWMFEVPRSGIRRVVIDAACVESGAPPHVEY